MREYTIGLKRCRKEAGMTQTDLANRSRVSQSLICKYERSEIAPSDKTVKRLADAIGCNSIDFFTDGLDEARDAARYLGISAESALKLRNMGEADKAFFDSAIRGYTA